MFKMLYSVYGYDISNITNLNNFTSDNLIDYFLGETVEAFDLSWHVSCFVCTTCGKPFENGKFINLERKPYWYSI